MLIAVKVHEVLLWVQFVLKYALIDPNLKKP